MNSNPKVMRVTGIFKKAPSILTGLFLPLLLVTALTACTTTASLDKTQDLTWDQITDYAFQADFSVPETKSRCHAVKIDLTHPDLLIESHYSPKGLSLTQAAADHNLDIAINTTQFYSQNSSGGKKAGLYPAGILKENISSPVQPESLKERYCALAIRKNGSNGYAMQIFPSQNESLLKTSGEFDIIHGGFFAILIDSNPIQYKEIKDARTCIGLTKDGKTLYILVAEGGFPSVYKGLSYNECARILLELGCCNAMEFDGGSSSSLVIRKKSVMSYPVRKIPVILGFKSR